jgi:hypothetical protein
MSATRPAPPVYRPTPRLKQGSTDVILRARRIPPAVTRLPREQASALRTSGESKEPLPVPLLREWKEPPLPELKRGPPPIPRRPGVDYSAGSRMNNDPASRSARHWFAQRDVRSHQEALAEAREAMHQVETRVHVDPHSKLGALRRAFTPDLVKQGLFSDTGSLLDGVLRHLASLEGHHDLAIDYLHRLRSCVTGKLDAIDAGVLAGGAGKIIGHVIPIGTIVSAVGGGLVGAEVHGGLLAAETGARMGIKKALTPASSSSSEAKTASAPGGALGWLASKVSPLSEADALKRARHLFAHLENTPGDRYSRILIKQFGGLSVIGQLVDQLHAAS